MTYCRLCLFESNSGGFKDIFKDIRVNLPAIIDKYMGIEITPGGVFSILICSNCANKLLEFVDFVKMCKHSQKILQDRYSVVPPDLKESKFIDNTQNCLEIDSSLDLSQDHDEKSEETANFKCNKCSQIFQGEKELLLHDSKHKISCEICSILLLPKSMKAHLLSHTDIYKCEECGLRHASRAALEKHQKARHANIKGFLCHICGKQSSCYSSMKRHMGYHSSERPHKCNHCEFSAKSSNIIQVHTLRQHQAERSVCEICAKIFKSQLSLAQHTKRIHHNNGKYTCEFCSKTFLERYSFNKHVKRHLNQRFYECKLCQQEFETVRKLKEHMHSHREGCIGCPQCGKQFFYKKYFYKHYEKCKVIS